MDNKEIIDEAESNQEKNFYSNPLDDRMKINLPPFEVTTLKDERKEDHETDKVKLSLSMGKRKKPCKKCSELQKRIDLLEDQLRINKLNFRSILDLSEERIVELLDKYYNESLYMEGKRGVINFIYSYVVRDEDDNIAYKCIDIEKGIFEYVDESGTIRRDRKCNQLFSSIYQPLIKRVNKIYRILLDKLYAEDDKTPYNSDEDEVLEVIEEELSIDEDERLKTVDDQINDVVRINLDIKKLGKNKKPVADELTRMLYI